VRRNFARRGAIGARGSVERERDAVIRCEGTATPSLICVVLLFSSRAYWLRKSSVITRLIFCRTMSSFSKDLSFFDDILYPMDTIRCFSMDIDALLNIAYICLYGASA
jgi:hypothetical protein